jgi:hypothetical protein
LAQAGRRLGQHLEAIRLESFPLDFQDRSELSTEYRVVSRSVVATSILQHVVFFFLQGDVNRVVMLGSNMCAGVQLRSTSPTMLPWLKEFTSPFEGF